MTSLTRFASWCKHHLGQLFGVLVLACLALLGLTYHRQIWAVLTQASARSAFVSYVQQAGAVGLLLFLALQVLQVVVAFLPGEPVELIAGLLYGAWGGLLICLAGILIGAMCIYGCVRLAGAHTVSETALHKYPFLRDEAHIKLCLFLVFFIPGTPKDMLIYLGPFLPVKPHTFFLISTLARIPSVFSSTFAASQFAAGQWQLSLAVYAVTGGIAALCVWQQERLLAAIAHWKERRTARKKNLEKTNKL